MDLLPYPRDIADFATDEPNQPVSPWIHASIGPRTRVGPPDPQSGGSERSQGGRRPVRQVPLPYRAKVSSLSKY